jgi:HEAT repeat protein
VGLDARMALPLMVASLRDSDRTIRELAAEVLGRIGDDSPVIVDALIHALKDEAAL